MSVADIGLPDSAIIDYGTAKVIHVHGLARVDIHDTDTLFALWRWRTTMIDGRTERVREVYRNVVMPTAAVGPGVELTLATFGPRLLLPAVGYVARRLVQ